MQATEWWQESKQSREYLPQSSCHPRCSRRELGGGSREKINANRAQLRSGTAAGGPQMAGTQNTSDDKWMLQARHVATHWGIGCAIHLYFMRFMFACFAVCSCHFYWRIKTECATSQTETK